MILWGHKTVAAFDVWSVEHVLSGISVGAVVWARASPCTRWSVVVALAFAWEALEHYLEMGVAGAAIATWFAGVEHWTNRLVTDPALVVVGAALAGRWPKLSVPARVLSAVWLLVHVVLLPHSMALHA